MLPWTNWSDKDLERMREMSPGQRAATVVGGLAIAAVALVLVYLLLH